MPQLPIETVIPDIQACLRNQRALVLQAPPGAGKTTLVPLALLQQSWLAGHAIVMLEPRRLAARAAAARMADLLGEPVGHTVGYRTRFDSKISCHTRIEVLTEGILTRRLQSDPDLEGVGLVIFDEFHERSLNADLALALCLQSQQILRNDLRLLVMSATLDGQAVARLLGNAPLLTCQGRSHPVTIHYLPRDPDGYSAEITVRTVLRALREQTGDILAFLPGRGEIRRVCGLLEADSACASVRLCPLYGDLPLADQQRAIQPDPQGRRKVVLATSIAETSLTIEGITAVVDAGWARLPRFEPRSGLSRLDTVRVAADSAEQRAGRAGRLSPGACYRLWSTATQQTLRPHRTPEILEADLAPLALELAQWGVSDAAELAWLDPPPAGALDQARELLADLEALDSQGRITASGRQLAALPLHPRLAHLLQRGVDLGLGELACDVAALLEERDILRGEEGAGSDLTTRVEALKVFRNHGRSEGADPSALAGVERAVRQWRARLKGIHPGVPLPRSGAAAFVTGTPVGLLLALAYPDRIAQRRDGSADRYRLASGRGARLLKDDPLVGQDWLVAAQLDAGNNEGRIFLAAPVALADLEQHLAGRVRDEPIVGWDIQQAAVIARQERRLGRLIIETRPLKNPAPARLRQAMVEGIRRLGLDSLPWTRDLRDWQARILSLRGWCPEQGWPDLSDDRLLASLEAWLEPCLDGVARREHLQRLSLCDILKSRLERSLHRRLEAAAPTHLRVPSGSLLRLRYTPGEAPVLAVKLQELFGLADTPRVAEGRVPVTLHLLSPAQRPIQVTQDLRGFWERTYAEVKRELKGRYPKHPWPDDPWTAIPTRRTAS